MKSSYASKLVIMLCCVGYDACLLSLHLDMCSKFVWHHTLSHCTLVLEVYKTYSALTFLDSTIFSRAVSNFKNNNFLRKTNSLSTLKNTLKCIATNPPLLSHQPHNTQPWCRFAYGSTELSGCHHNLNILYKEKWHSGDIEAWTQNI